MKYRLKTLAALAGLCAAASCVNINIYFPEAEVREAAEEIVGEVRPEVAGAGNETGAPQGSSSQAPDPEPTKSRLTPEVKTSGSVWSLLGSHAAWAEEKKGDKKIELDVKSPVIKKIKETLKARYAKLLPLYEKGAIGEGANGYLAAKDTDGLSLKEKRDVQTLLSEENDDRKNLYAEIVKSNGIEDSYVERVGQLFSAEWQKKSKAGWWIEPTAGKWEKKKKS